MTRKFGQAKRDLGDTLAEHGQSRTVLVIHQSKEPDDFPPAHILDQFGKQHRRICSIRDGNEYRNYSLAGDSSSALDEFLDKSKKLGAWGIAEKVILRVSSPHPIDLWIDTIFTELSDTPEVKSLSGGHFYMEAFPSACETARIVYDRAIVRNKENIPMSSPNDEPHPRPRSNSAPTSNTQLDLSDTKLLLLRTVSQLGAVSSAKKVTGSDIAGHSKMTADQRLRSELASLRDLRLLGGDKGTRGYWLTTAGQAEAERA